MVRIKDRTQVAGEINSFLAFAFQNRLAIALWRFPRKTSLNGVIGKPDPDKILNLESSSPGFILHPFDHIQEAPSWKIPADFHFSWDQTDSQILKLTGHYPIETVGVESKMREFYINPGQPCDMSDTKERYLDLVNSGIQAIADGKFDKVVLARTKHITWEKSFSPGLYLLALMEKYPHAFTACVSHPEFGTWIGASPELLLEVEPGRKFRTVALAGTQENRSGNGIAQAAWTQKEIEEQAMVSRFIINQFKKIRLREFVESGPKTIAAGNILHLRTDFEVDLQKVDYPDLGTSMMRLLHPTSAVCGMPKLPAREFILKEESFSRNLYSGFWGPVNIAGKSSLYVNLRTLQLDRNGAVIYAGNGITHDSDPDAEWAETELKCATMLDAL